MTCTDCDLRFNEGICVNDFNLERFASPNKTAKTCKSFFIKEGQDSCPTSKSMYYNLKDQCAKFNCYFDNIPKGGEKDPIEEYCQICILFKDDSSTANFLQACQEEVKFFYNTFCPAFTGNVKNTSKCIDWMKECYYHNGEKGEGFYLPLQYDCIEGTAVY